jgi:hypothetical protein
MKITDVTTHWEHCDCGCDKSLSSPVELIRAYKPTIRGKVADLLGANTQLSEATVKEIKSLFDDDFLRQRERATELEGFRKFGFKGDTLTYYVPSSKSREPGHAMEGKGYHVKVQFVQWPQLVEDVDLNANEAAWMAYWIGDVRLSCTCPSFLYWGMQYLCTSIDAAIYPEVRKPVKMNPQERGIVCKHLRRVLDYLGTNLTDISTEFRNYRNMNPDSRRQEINTQRRQQKTVTQKRMDDLDQ